MPKERLALPAETLLEIAREARIDVIRMLAEAKSGHPGGSLSEMDLLVALFFHEMRHDPEHPDDPDRDRFILSKGHGVPGLYAVLARAGYFPREELMTLRKTGSRLQGHPDRLRFPLMEASTGSLGQGLSIAQGMAIASKLYRRERGLSDDPFRVYCLLGDGEIQEGQIWEAAMSAPKFELDNLTAILDYNKGQIDGHVSEVMNIEPVEAKWAAFGWNVLRIDGHDMTAILSAYRLARRTKGRPTIIVADTIKGKGVSFMEDVIAWHGKAPSPEEAQRAIAELRGER